MKKTHQIPAIDWSLLPDFASVGDDIIDLSRTTIQAEGPSQSITNQIETTFDTLQPFTKEHLVEYGRRYVYDMFLKSLERGGNFGSSPQNMKNLKQFPKDLIIDSHDGKKIRYDKFMEELRKFFEEKNYSDRRLLKELMNMSPRKELTYSGKVKDQILKDFSLYVESYSLEDIKIKGKVWAVLSNKECYKISEFLEKARIYLGKQAEYSEKVRTNGAMLTLLKKRYKEAQNKND